MPRPVALNIRASIRDNGDLDSELTEESGIQWPEQLFDERETPPPVYGNDKKMAHQKCYILGKSQII
jgi:hypothetical protein